MTRSELISSIIARAASATTIIFVLLKLFAGLQWSWLWVFSPVIIIILLGAFFTALSKILKEIALYRAKKVQSDALDAIRQEGLKRFQKEHGIKGNQ